MTVSIITASYNYQDYIKETIESIINQTYKDWELIVVDDGSTDNSVEVIKSYCEKDPRIKLYTHENNENKGLMETIKYGLSKTNNEWIAFLESDDIWAENYLEEKIKYIKKYPEIDFFFNDIEMFGDEKRIEENNRDYKVIYDMLRAKPFPRNIQKYFCKFNPVFTFSCVMVKKTALLKCGFRAPIQSHLDHWLYFQLAKNDFYFIDEKLTKWRIHPSSYIKRDKEKIRANIKKMRFKIIKKCPKTPQNIIYILIALLEYNSFIEKSIRGIIKKLKLIEAKNTNTTPDFILMD